MSRIFVYLAAVAVCLFVATFLLGLSLRGGDLRDRENVAIQQRATVHRLAGIAAGLGIVLVESIVVTYFIGTSRWCKEVVDTYALDQALTRRAAALKRRTFPHALLGMLTAVGVAALGGAADPGAIVQAPAASLSLPILEGLGWNDVHLAAAGLGLAVIGYGFVVQWGHLAANQAIIGEVLADVKRVRAERGLET